jgi:hypothetical protein
MEADVIGRPANDRGLTAAYKCNGLVRLFAVTGVAISGRPALSWPHHSGCTFDYVPILDVVAGQQVERVVRATVRAKGADCVSTS